MKTLVERRSPGTDYWMGGPKIFVPWLKDSKAKEWPIDFQDALESGWRPGSLNGKKPKESPTIGPYPETANDDFQEKVDWIAGLDIDEETKKQLLGTLAQQVLLPKGKVTTPEELDKFLEVASRYGRDAVKLQGEELQKLARQKAIYRTADTAIEGARAVAVAGLPHKDYVSGHGLTAGLGKPSNISRTYFG